VTTAAIELSTIPAETAMAWASTVSRQHYSQDTQSSIDIDIYIVRVPSFAALRAACIDNHQENCDDLIKNATTEHDRAVKDLILIHDTALKAKISSIKAMYDVIIEETVIGLKDSIPAHQGPLYFGVRSYFISFFLKFKTLFFLCTLLFY
jgi:hypothetical protein